jgi:hypothetical protein
MWTLLGLLSGVGGVLKSIASETTIRAVATLKYSSNVFTAAMNHNIFWYVWATAAFPTVIWYGWGMVDTTFPGHLPHTALIPNSLKPWFEIVWQNIFWTGAAGYGIHTAGNIATSLIGRWFGNK